MTACKLDHKGVLAFEKAIWIARISSVLSDNHYTVYDVLELLRYEATMRNIPCISDTTVGRYLREMVKRGMLVTEIKRVGRRAPMKYYGKVKL